ncbi:MAG: dihydrofolate reductase [Bacteroidaceae bacterium]
MNHISIVVAVSLNYAIGYQNKLIYWLPNDLKHFKALTTGHTIIMGRHTFESLPKGALPNRRNIVLSRNLSLKCEGAEVYSSLEEALTHCENEEIFIIGGGSVYKQAMTVADRICLTQINNIPTQADTFFPNIDPLIWKEIERENHLSDEKHLYSYSFVTYTKA